MNGIHLRCVLDFFPPRRSVSCLVLYRNFITLSFHPTSLLVVKSRISAANNGIVRWFTPLYSTRQYTALSTQHPARCPGPSVRCILGCKILQSGATQPRLSSHHQGLLRREEKAATVLSFTSSFTGWILRIVRTCRILAAVVASPVAPLWCGLSRNEQSWKP